MLVRYVIWGEAFVSPQAGELNQRLRMLDAFFVSFKNSHENALLEGCVFLCAQFFGRKYNGNINHNKSKPYFWTSSVHLNKNKSLQLMQVPFF